MTFWHNMIHDIIQELYAMGNCELIGFYALGELPISGSKVTAIVLKGWILPLDVPSSGEGLRSRLVN